MRLSARSSAIARKPGWARYRPPRSADSVRQLLQNKRPSTDRPLQPRENLVQQLHESGRIVAEPLDGGERMSRSRWRAYVESHPAQIHLQAKQIDRNRSDIELQRLVGRLADA